MLFFQPAVLYVECVIVNGLLFVRLFSLEKIHTDLFIYKK